MSLGRRRIIPAAFNASGIVGQNASAGPLFLHGFIFTETGGVTNETLTLYVPTASTGGANPAAPSASGTEIGEIIVVKGTTVTQWYGDEGLYFEWGLYIAAAGGTLKGTLFYS